MEEMFNSLIKGRQSDDKDKRDHAIREALQELIINALSKTDFFTKAAFAGGTALRIFHGLNRFSEDLDFVLKETDLDFDLKRYLDAVKSHLSKYGIEFIATVTEKAIHNNIKSGVISANSRELVLSFYSNEEYADKIYKTELTKIKIDVDIEPAPHARYEERIKTKPIRYSASLFDMPTMLSGKIHAILCRDWKNRVKGRDLYDFIFLVDRDVAYNADYLKCKLIKSGFDDNEVDSEKVRQLLIKKFTDLDYDSAKKDVKNFMTDSEIDSLDYWGPELFVSLCDRLKS